MNFRKQKAHTYGHTHIHTCIHMYVSKVNLYPLNFGQLWTYWFNRLSQHVHRHAHTDEQIIFVELAIAVFSTCTQMHIKWTLYFNYFYHVIMIIKLFVSLYLLLSHSICLRAGKICVVFVETKPQSNSHKLRKVLSPPHKYCYLTLIILLNSIHSFGYSQMASGIAMYH